MNLFVDQSYFSFNFSFMQCSSLVYCNISNTFHSPLVTLQAGSTSVLEHILNVCILYCSQCYISTLEMYTIMRYINSHFTLRHITCKLWVRCNFLLTDILCKQTAMLHNLSLEFCSYRIQQSADCLVNFTMTILFCLYHDYKHK